MNDDNPSTSKSTHEFSCELAVDEEPGESTGDITGPLLNTWWPSASNTLPEIWTAEKDGCDINIAVILTGRSRIHSLNRDYRGKDRPTDVLTFDLSDSPDETEGEIYISIPVAREQADHAGVSLEEELSRLLIHGLLHLAGHDHHTPAEGRKMAAATRRWIPVMWPEN